MSLPAPGSTNPESSQPVDVGLQEILGRARMGDGEAFDEIYRRFARTVHGIVLARVGSYAAEDVTQDIFLAIHRGLDSVQ